MIYVVGMILSLQLIVIHSCQSITWVTQIIVFLLKLSFEKVSIIDHILQVTTLLLSEMLLMLLVPSLVCIQMCKY